MNLKNLIKWVVVHAIFYTVLCAVSYGSSGNLGGTLVGDEYWDQITGGWPVPGNGDGSHYSTAWYVAGVYPNQSSAQAACNSNKGSCAISTDCNGYSSGAGDLNWNSSKWRSYFTRVRIAHSGSGTYCPSGNTYFVLNALFVYPTNTSYWQWDVDLDGDGLGDHKVDPYPDDDRCFKWRLSSYQVNTGGAYTWIRIETDKGDFFQYGDYDATKTTYFQAVKEMSDCTALNQFFGAGTLLAGHEGKTDPRENPFPGTDLDEGEGNDGNSTVEQYLADVVTNTKATADNQSDQMKGLDTINSNLVVGNELSLQANGLLQGIKDGVGGGGTGVGTGITQGEVEAAVGAALDARGSEATGDFSGITGEGVVDALTLGEGDIPVKGGGAGGSGTITEILGDWMGNVSNGIGGVITGSGVEATGNCSFSGTFYGKTVTFGVCDYESQLSTMGLVLLGLAQLYGIMIIAGRGY